HSTDAGVAFPDYVERWPTLRPFERCLYYWAEVHAFGLNLATGANVPWLRLRFENMTAGNDLLRLFDFLGLEARPEETAAAQREHVDSHHFHLVDWMEPAAIERHPS